MIIENKFEIGEIVYLKTDKEQSERLITQITISPAGLRYCASMGSADTWHYEIELSSEKNILITTS